jgi:ankyrin repeat protein
VGLSCGGSARASAAAHAAVARRRTPLHCAANNGHVDAIAALLGAGADASIQDRDG